MCLQVFFYDVNTHHAHLLNVILLCYSIPIGFDFYDKRKKGFRDWQPFISITNNDAFASRRFSYCLHHQVFWYHDSFIKSKYKKEILNNKLC